MAILSTYPSYAEATVLLALYPLFPHILTYTRNTLISFGTIVAALVLSPIMWRMWMITGSGNANFYFAITVVYTFALVISSIVLSNEKLTLELHGDRRFLWIVQDELHRHL